MKILSVVGIILLIMLAIYIFSIVMMLVVKIAKELFLWLECAYLILKRTYTLFVIPLLVVWYKIFSEHSNAYIKYGILIIFVILGFTMSVWFNKNEDKIQMAIESIPFIRIMKIKSNYKLAMESASMPDELREHCIEEMRKLQEKKLNRKYNLRSRK